MSWTFYEFFAGAGMARLGLGERWRCLFANDIDAKKAACYTANFGDREFMRGDVAELDAADLPGAADLAWASFPCQDLSLAGAGAGLRGARSGTFWPFWRLIEALGAAARAPKAVAIENVIGLLRARGGADFIAIAEGIAKSGYRLGAMVIDAADFLPQSRPRLFLIAVREDLEIPAEIIAAEAAPHWTIPALAAAHDRLGQAARARWIWWKMRQPEAAPPPLAAIIDPDAARWHRPEETERLLGLMNELHRRKVADAVRASLASDGPIVGTIYRRTRVDENSVRRQRAEARFDGIAGCLRTPAGGSSRQTVVVAERGRMRTRLLSAREAARLMGLPESFVLPARFNDAYHVAGDGVAVPVVRFLAAHLLEPLLDANADVETAAMAGRRSAAGSEAARAAR